MPTRKAGDCEKTLLDDAFSFFDLPEINGVH